jgi:hypothetical protein
MTDLFKQLFDAASERIRSPFFGSILISFIGFNWRELFYLLFADKPVRARILYFDANTDVWSLFVYPVALGILLALLMPWVSYLGAIVARLPHANLHSVQHGEVSRKRIHEFEQKAKEEEVISRLEAATEQRRIDAAKRLEEAEEVSVELGEELSEERSSQQPDGNNSKFGLLYKKMPKEARRVLDSSARSKTGRLRVTEKSIYFEQLSEDRIEFPEHRRDRIKFSKALEWLEKYNLIIEVKDSLEVYSNADSNEFEITEIGYQFHEYLEEIPPF